MEHGTNSMYTSGKCRCDACRIAHRDAARINQPGTTELYHARRQAAGRPSREEWLQQTRIRLINGKKRCPGCKIAKQPDEFYRNNGQPLGIDVYCIECKKKQAKAHSASLSLDERRMRRRRQHLALKYGLTLQQYEELLTQQDFRCAICTKSHDETWHGPRSRNGLLRIDHDHVTGTVRGLLCHNCNTLIGHARDNPQILEHALRYLAR